MRCANCGHEKSKHIKEVYRRSDGANSTVNSCVKYIPNPLWDCECKQYVKPKVCIHCKKEKGIHLAKTYNCPIGMKTRAGYTSFGKTKYTEEK